MYKNNVALLNDSAAFVLALFILLWQFIVECVTLLCLVVLVCNLL